MEIAHHCGFSGMQITDGGGYLQPHPLNNGFVEYERFGLDLRRKDSFPLTDRYVQESYLIAAETFEIQLTGIYLYLLNHQGFIKYSKKSTQGQQCLDTIRNAVLAAKQMNIPMVTVPAYGLFGAGQHHYAFEKLEYAVNLGADYGVQIAFCSDMPFQKQLDIMDRLKGKLRLDFSITDPTLYDTGISWEVITSMGKDRFAQFRVQDLKATDEGYLIKEESQAALLGEGDAQFRKCAEAIVNSGYTGWIISETPYYADSCGGDDLISRAKKDIVSLKEVLYKK